MDTDEAIALLKRNERAVFNAYRKANPDWTPDFSGRDLTGIYLVGASEVVNLDNAILTGAKLPSATYFTRDGSYPSLNGAIIDSETRGQSLTRLQSLGAKYATKAQVQKRNEVKSTRVFISYAWANSQVVTAIDKWLRLKGLDTIIDKRDFFAGERIRDEIARLMKDSDVVLVFHSIESKGKPWIEFERELVADIQMAARKDGATPPRVIYVVIDGTPLPSISEDNRLAIMAKGKRFELVCEEIYHQILQLPRDKDEIDLSKWDEYIF